MPWVQFYALPDAQQRRLRAELPDPGKYDFRVSPSTGMLARALRNRELIRRQTPPPLSSLAPSKGDLSNWRSAPTFHLNREGL